MKIINNYFKMHWKDMLSVSFFLVCYATSILLFLGGNVDPTKPSDLDFPVFLPFAIADIVLMIVFVFLENKYFKMKINIPLIIILSCLFIVNLIVIATTPLDNLIEFIYKEPSSLLITITNEYKVMYVFCFLLLLLNIYITISYAIYRLEFKKQFVWVCSLIVVAGLFFVIYSYIAEHEIYKLFFENISEDIKDYSPKSLTNHPNNYAAILLGAGFASFGLDAVTKKHAFLILCVFFCVNIIFPTSRICLILSALFLILVFAYEMIVSWKEHRRRNLVLVLVAVSILVSLIIIFFSIPAVKIYIERVIFTYNITGDARKLLWECAISIITGVHCFVGMGHGYFNTVFASINEEHVKMPHNLYLQTYCSLGILGVVAFAALICFIVYKIVKLFKTNREAALVSIIGLIIVLSYYLGEG